MRRLLSTRIDRVGTVAVVAAVASMIVAAAAPVEPAEAGHSPTFSSGIYRVPYADGTEVTVNNDAHNHNDAYDLTAGADAEIVAAASGWIRAIVDQHGEEPNPGDGEDINGDPQDDSLEHACGNNDPTETVVGSCGDYNNYVWIEHPNGEWTKYTHLGTGTVGLDAPAGFGWEVGDWINAGQVIGLENDIGQATSSGQPGDRAFHLHWEVAIPDDPNEPMPFCELGGFMVFSIPDCAGSPFGDRVAAVVCDIPGNELLAGDTRTANPCEHDPPTADAGGPYVVDEGSGVQLDGTGSSDPEGNPLTYAWFPPTNLDDPSLAQPTYTGVDDGIFLLVLNVYDQIEALPSQAFTGVTVNNVAPTVTAVGDALDEGLTASVSATFVDPGALDTHSAAIDWGDGSPAQAVTIFELAAGVSHVYGDNGTFEVTVTVTDDDGGVGVDTADVVVGNVAPTLSLDDSAAIAFPGGDFVVVQAGGELAWSADGSDPGSDDLAFAWSTGEVNTYFNDGVGPDPFPSPDGTFPFAASDQANAVYAVAGAETLAVTLADDDGGIAANDAGVIVTGTADSTEGTGWWKHQFGGNGSPQLDTALLDGYLDAVNAASSVFSEDAPALTHDDIHEILSPTAGDRRAHARAALIGAWLHFVSGAVAWDATVPLGGGESVVFLTLMFEGEEVVLDPDATNAELGEVERRLTKVRHAE